ncbi:hypothetical protein OVA29_17465 [Exiguobacterium sp. SL14]|nr:hypothetical protein [Exiguobacterium sp. SL14]MCY1692158.1 hypothetical protein [Exiguobacterium sp. SL14]
MAKEAYASLCHVRKEIDRATIKYETTGRLRIDPVRPRSVLRPIIRCRKRIIWCSISFPAVLRRDPFWRRNHEKLAILFYIVGTIILAGVVLSSVAIGFVIAGILLYLGIILVTRHSVREFLFSRIAPHQYEEEGIKIQPAYSFSTQADAPYVLQDLSEQFIVKDLEIDLTHAYVPKVRL